MISCLGVDPGGAGWWIAPLALASPQDAAGEIESCFAPLPAGARTAWGQEGVFGWCDRQIRELADLGREPLLDDGPLVRELAAHPTLLSLPAVYYDQRSMLNLDTPSAVGVCFPYATPPLVRRLLPILFDGNPIVPARRGEGSLSPRETELSEGTRLCGVESPVAGCLDLVARGAVSLPADLWLMTGTATATELTALGARLTGDELQVTIRGSRALSGSLEPKALEEQTRPWATSRRPHKLVTYGDAAAPLARRAAQAIGLPEQAILEEPEERLAAGAARYAAMCLDRTLHGAPAPIHRLNVRGVLPHDLGVICTLADLDSPGSPLANTLPQSPGNVSAGEKPAYVWHRLFTAGESPPDAPLRLPITGSPPRALVFAARRNHAARSHAWLERELWREHQVAWFAAAPLELPEEQAVSGLAVRLAYPSDRIACRWCDVTVEVVPET
jgi:hypothetical protein